MSVSCSDHAAHVLALALGQLWVANHPDADVLNVRDLGAKGDGQADDTPAIQTALYSYFVHEDQRPKGAHVYIPAGRYRIVCPLQIPAVGKKLPSDSGSLNSLLFSYFRITLHPDATLVFDFHGPASRALFEGPVYPPDSCWGGFLIIEGGRLTATVPTALPVVPQHGIKVSDSNVTIRDVLIDNFSGHGISIPNNLTGSNRIENCHIYSNWQNGIDIAAGTATVIDRCRIEFNWGWGTRVVGNEVVISNNVIEGNGHFDPAFAFDLNPGLPRPKDQVRDCGEVLVEYPDDAGPDGCITAILTGNRFEGDPFNVKPPAITANGKRCSSIVIDGQSGDKGIVNPKPVSLVVFEGNYLIQNSNSGFSSRAGIRVGGRGGVKHAVVSNNYFAGFSVDPAAAIVFDKFAERFYCGQNVLEPSMVLDRRKDKTIPWAFVGFDAKPVAVKTGTV
jgi:hypothetical protein